VDDHSDIHRRERRFHQDRTAYEQRRRTSVLGYRGNVNSANDRLVTAISGFPGRRVLDLGCGTGWLSRAIKDRFEVVISLDIVTEVLSDDLTAVCGTAEDLPFDDDSFDAVVGSGVLHHAADLPGALGEIRRVTREDGRIAFAEPLSHHPIVATYRRLTPKARSRDEHPFRLDDLCAAFAPFADVEITPLELTTVLAAPLNAVIPLRRRVVPAIAGRLRRLDQALLRKRPNVGRFAWCAVVTAWVEK
jgi:SAM-dependent methyltransferase